MSKFFADLSALLYIYIYIYVLYSISSIFLKLHAQTIQIYNAIQTEIII